MKNIIEQNYDTTVKRGLINNKTRKIDFLDKILEEFKELDSHYFLSKGQIDPFELADIIMVCLNMAHHYDIDIEKVIKQKIEINKNR